MVTNSDLLERLLWSLVIHSKTYTNPGFDAFRFGGSRGGHFKRRLRAWVNALALRAGYVPRRIPRREQATAGLLLVRAQLPALSSVYDALGDEYSKDLFVTLLCARILGARQVALPTMTPSYWRTYQSVTGYRRRSRVVRSRSEVMPWLDEYEVPGHGGPIRFLGHPLNVLNTFLIRQYDYARGPVRVSVRSGDMVVDGGSCWGDTALYFADRAGPASRVYAFEFNADNLSTLRANMSRNPRLAERIHVVPNALWHQSGGKLTFGDDGPGTTVRTGVDLVQSSDRTVDTLSLDDFVAQNSLDRVDYIKLDIEGAEMAALRGAERTIRAHKPRLAISLYHRPEDIVDIPQYLLELDAGYTLYLDHFTVHREETVLFATPVNV